MQVPFNQQAFDENDARARAKAKLLLSKFFTVKDHQNEYAVDLVGYNEDGSFKCFIEVEVKNRWVGQSFPWNEINVPTRKEKFFKIPESVVYIMFNSDLSSCFVMDNRTIMASKKQEVPNRRVARGEYFFKVPYEKVLHLKNLN